MLPTSCGPGPPTKRKPPRIIDRTPHASTLFLNTFLSSKTSLSLSPPPPTSLSSSSSSSSSSEPTSLIKNVGHPTRSLHRRDEDPKRHTGRRPISFCSTFSLQLFVKLFSIFCFVILTASNGASAEKSKNYYMRALCRNHFLQQLYRKIDGTVLWSQNERNLDCVITFQTHSILQRFMLRFDMLQLDCNDHLYVYDGAHPVGAYKADLSCRNTKQTVGSIFTRTNFVTLKYVTDGWGTDTNGFKLVITAVKDPKHACKDFRCAQREFCIHPDLVCDGINHCGDGSDESTSTLCQNQDPSTLLGLEITWFVLVAVSSVLVICACIVGLAICLCRRNTRNSSNQNTSIQLHQTLESNGSSKHLHGTLPREHTSLPSSGNWLHPAGPSGYLRIQHILKMATKVRPIWCLAN